MEGTSAVIVLLFVYVMFTSLGGGKSGPGFLFGQPADTIIAKTDFSQHFTESPTGELTADTNEEELISRIRIFIMSYTKERGGVNSNATIIAKNIVKYSKLNNLNPKLIAAIIARESGFNPNAISSTGAQGLGQLVPSTAASIGVENAFDIEQNIMGTTKYFRYLLNRWKGEEYQVALALASYFEGPNAVRRKDGVKLKSKGYIRDIFALENKI